MVKLTLKQCSYFLAVADHGGITQAARALNISQPAVAQALDKLEAIYGLRLLQRHHARGTELTPEGRSFLELARTLLDYAEHVEHRAQAIADHLAGSVRFGCFHTIAPFYLARLIKSYRADLPDVEIKPFELTQDQIVNDLASGKLDLALTYDMGLDRDRLDWTVAVRLKPFVLLKANHRLAAETSISLTKLGEEPFVMFDGLFSRAYFESVLSAANIDPPVSLNASSMESVRCAVGNGLGFSLSVMNPEHSQTYDGGTVVSIPLADNIKPIELGLARRKEMILSGLISRFAAFCLAHMQTPYINDDSVP